MKPVTDFLDENGFDSFNTEEHEDYLEDYYIELEDDVYLEGDDDSSSENA